MSSSKILFNTFKVILQYLFNIYILLNSVFNLKLIFKLRIDPKVRNKTWKKFGKPEIKNFNYRVATLYTPNKVVKFFSSSLYNNQIYNVKQLNLVKFLSIILF